MYVKPPAFIPDPKTGKFSYSVEDFSAVGQDSYSTPPSQDPVQWEALTNIMPIVRGGLRRRRGYANFLTDGNSLPYYLGSTLVQNMWNYQRDSDGKRAIIVASGGFDTDIGGDESSGIITIASFNDGGVIDNVFIADPFLPPTVTVSRDFAYFASGKDSDLIKWDGSSLGGSTKWGIALNATEVSAQQGMFAGAASSVKWANPTSAIGASNGSFTTTNVSVPTDNNLSLSDFGFSLPAGSTILNIAIAVQATNNRPRTATSGSSRVIYRLTKAGIPFGNPNFHVVSNPVTLLTDTGFGLWGGVWTADDINDLGFGVNIHFENDYADQQIDTCSIDAVELLITYIPSGAVGVSTSGAGLVNLTVGRIYYCIFQNSETGHYGDLNPASSSSGPCTNSTISLSNLPVSADSQVDTKILLATADGGDETTLYIVASLPNVSTSFIDNTPETTLVQNQLYLVTDEFGNEFGVSGNQPPPQNGAICIKHRGRMWMSAGQTLFFSKSLGEVTLPNGFIAGKYEESWPGDNSFDVSEGAEEIRGLLSDGQTLYIGTERHVLRLLGDDPTNFTEPEIVHPEAGVVNHRVWQLVFLEGTPAGAMWLTPDCKILGSDFNSYHDAGNPIQDVLNSINKDTFQRTACAQFLADGPLNLYILAIPTGSHIYPDTLCVYNMKTHTWVVWQTPDPTQSLLYNVDANGNSRWLMGSSGFVYEFSDDLFQDISQDPPSGVIGSTLPSGFIPPVGAEDLLQWMLNAQRDINHYKGNANPTYGYLDPDGRTLWHIKGASGHPWDINLYDNHYIYQWITENGDQGQFNNASGYKRFDVSHGNAIPQATLFAPRYFMPGSTITLDSPSPNNIHRTINCEADHQALINLGAVKCVTTGPVLTDWGGDIGNVPTITTAFYYGNKFNTRERFSFVKDKGQVNWDVAVGTFGGAYTVSQFSRFNVLTSGGTPIPNYPCGRTTAAWIATHQNIAEPPPVVVGSGGGVIGATQTPNPIDCFAQTSWLEFGTSTYRKILDEMEIIGDPNVIVSVYGASTDDDFEQPVPIVVNKPLVTGPFGTFKAFLYTASTKYKFYQFYFTGQGVLNNTFLDGYTVKGALFNNL